VKELIKAALSHNGIAVLDIVSPCVTFNNQDNAYHSYTWGKDHEAPLHEISFIPARDEIMIPDEFEEGTVREVEMHDGSTIILKKLEKDYDPTDKWQALQILEEAQRNNWMVTGLIYVETDQPSLSDRNNLPKTALNRLKEKDLRPLPDTLDKINASLL
jgi:2-oxoglutarate ferredoxin oxidoreductase subunit beta